MNRFSRESPPPGYPTLDPPLRGGGTRCNEIFHLKSTTRVTMFISVEPADEFYQEFMRERRFCFIVKEILDETRVSSQALLVTPNLV